MPTTQTINTQVVNDKYKQEIRTLLNGSQLYNKLKTCKEQREPLFIQKNQLQKELDKAIQECKVGDIAKKTRAIQDIDIQAQALEDSYKECMKQLKSDRNHNGVLAIDNPNGYRQWADSYATEAIATLQPLYDELNATYARALELNNQIYKHKNEFFEGYTECLGIAGDTSNGFSELIQDSIIEVDYYSQFLNTVRKKSQEKPYKGSHHVYNV